MDGWVGGAALRIDGLHAWMRSRVPCVRICSQQMWMRDAKACVLLRLFGIERFEGRAGFFFSFFFSPSKRIRSAVCLSKQSTGTSVDGFRLSSADWFLFRLPLST
jgi:hypothetical protein